MRYIITLSLMLLLVGCQEERPDIDAISLPPESKHLIEDSPPFSLNESDYRDKILGLLVGSAIGDAMGSPVEMWSRSDIAFRYGFVTDFLLNARPASAEGPWGSNLVAGTGTDDTRWKQLMGVYLLKTKSTNNISPEGFTKFIADAYDELRQELTTASPLAADRLDNSTRYLQWLQEWVKVAAAYQSGEVDEYADAVAKFYGGEMSCAGMLYAPMLGITHAQRPRSAYRAAWSLSLFDIGYAKDITAMTAALTAAAFDSTKNTEQLLQLHYDIDEARMADSRLIGRVVNTIYETALRDYYNSQQIDSVQVERSKIPTYFQDRPSKYEQLLYLYDRMQPQLKSIPFHAHEIYLISLYALLFADGDFMDAMVFITNFGRDNDTVAAVVGSMMGAQLGYKKLPKELSATVVQVQKEKLNIDLIQLAETLGDVYYEVLTQSVTD
ncbi:MAG: ADP-ribosylglycohydrolase family protein [Bacteroidota bacterium]